MFLYELNLFYLNLTFSGNWGPWGPWGLCSTSCLGGTKVRRRMQPCTGETEV